ncbi:MAG: hypothetical protein HY672_00875 [Chloroflexi bacterium]|nr:hypothetical protein [Chloroflexota bacterium]
MTSTCAHCGSDLEERTPIADWVDLSAMQKMQVGCRRCGTPVCLGCGAAAASRLGIERNCLCPNCGAELGLGGEVDELGEDYYGWGY